MSNVKNGLSIRLTEPVVFLRTNDPSGRHGPDSGDPPGLVRGLLTLNLTKPTRISSIEVELRVVATQTWAEGAGPRQMDITDEHTIYSQTITCFRADEHPSTRRTASVGPGLSLMNANDYDHDFYSQGDDDGHQRPPTYTATAPPNPTVQGGYRPQGLRNISCDFSRDSAQDRTRSLTYSPSTRSPLTAPPSASTTTPPPVSVHFSPSLGNPSIATRSTVSLRSGVYRDFSPPRRIPSSDEDVLPRSRYSPGRTDGISRSPDYGDGTASLRIRDTSSTRDTSTSRDASVPRVGRARSRFILTTVLDVVKEVTGIGTAMRRMTLVEDIGTRTKAKDGRSSKKACPSAIFNASILTHVAGIHTYPIIIPFPANLPPTYKLPCASLSYSLRGVAHRPGAFAAKLTCSTPFVVVSAPAVSASEGGGGIGAGPPGDPGPITVERIWDGKLGYAVELSGRLLIIGAGAGDDHSGVGEREANNNGTIRQSSCEDLAFLPTNDPDETPQTRTPGEGTIILGINLAPLEKVKVWRIAAFIDEKVTYLSRTTRAGREAGLHRVALLNVEDAEYLERSEDSKDQDARTSKDKHKALEKTKEPIPLIPTPLSPHRSPLLRFLRPGADPSELIGPGPYNLTINLAIPRCRNDSGSPLMSFTMRHHDAGARVEHTLRIVIRVEKLDENQDDASSTREETEEDKKKRLFDIVVQVPVTALSCRCAPEWQALPRYSEVLESDISRAHAACPCDMRRDTPAPVVRTTVVSGGQLARVYTNDSGSSTSESGNVSNYSNGVASHIPASSRSSSSVLSSRGNLVAQSQPPTSLSDLQARNSPLPPDIHTAMGSSGPPSRAGSHGPSPTGQECDIQDAPPSYESATGVVA
ncbi:hypothetical protein ID866_6772 [Astraeus odoratus]|nr:hypothetical protein ID866_6772 [Astraeus odoratus]